MPLQLRRGTTAERLSIVPLPGEPILDTDLNTIFVGNGTTAGGISAFTGITSENAMDIVGQMFLNGQHENIIFTYGSTQDTANRIDVRLDLSNYDGEFAASAFRGSLYANDSTLLVNADTGEINSQAISGTFGGPIAASQITTAILTADNMFGTLTGDMIGSVFADSSILLVNGVDGSINLDGTIKGDIIPAGNELYDIGSSSNRFKDLYLSGTTIFLGNATLTSTGTTINLPPGSTIDGTPIGSSSGDGVIAGNNYRINIIGDDSSIIINTATNTVSGNIQGNIFTDLIDSPTSSLITMVPSVNLLSSLTVDSSLTVRDGAVITGNLEVDGEFRGFNNEARVQLGQDIIFTSDTGLIRFITPVGAAVFGSPIENGTGNIYVNRTGYSGNPTSGITLGTNHGFTPEIDGFNFLRSRGSSSAFLPLQQFDLIGNTTYVGFDGNTNKVSTRYYVSADVVNSTTIKSNFTFESLDDSGIMTQRFRILSSGRVCIGALSPTDNQTGLAGLEVFNTQYVEDKNAPGKPLHIKQFYDGQPANGFNAARSRGTRATPLPVQGGDQLFEITVLGNVQSLPGSGVFGLAARINFTAADTLFPGVVPGIISLDVAGNDGTLLEAVKVKQDGKLYSNYGIIGDVVGSVFADDSTMIIDSTEGGKITAPSVTVSDFLQLPVFANDSARLSAIPSPTQGMVIFMQSGTTPAAVNKIQFFDGSNWTNL